MLHGTGLEYQVKLILRVLWFSVLRFRILRVEDLRFDFARVLVSSKPVKKKNICIRKMSPARVKSVCWGQQKPDGETEKFVYKSTRMSPCEVSKTSELRWGSMIDPDGIHRYWCNHDTHKCGNITGSIRYHPDMEWVH